MPPLATDKESRILFLDLTDELLAEVRGRTGTAFIPETASVLRSGFYKFFDEGYISGVHLTQKVVPRDGRRQPGPQRLRHQPVALASEL